MTNGVTDAGSERKRGKRITGICGDAEKLGVSRQHLYAVLTQRRTSAPLLARYLAFGREQPSTPSKTAPTKRTPPPINFAAAQNFDQKFSEYLLRLKLDVVILRLEFRQDSPALAFPNLTDELDAELHGAGAGQYDSSAWFQGSVQHYFYSQELGKAAQIIKAGIASRGLLDTAQIFVKEINGMLTEWFPATGNEIPT